MSDLVECHSGYLYAERPQALTWQGERLSIQRILTTWVAPGKRCFRVEVADGRQFELVYDEGADCWDIQLS